MCAEAEERAEHQNIRTKHNQMTAFRLVCPRNEKRQMKDVLEKRALFNIVIGGRERERACVRGRARARVRLQSVHHNGVLPLKTQSTSAACGNMYNRCSL